MGCDGGSIPKREELVKQKRKIEKKDKDAELAGKWKYCSLSSEKLQKPIVSCCLGKLYNKEEIIKHLLNKSNTNSNSSINHIKSLKDVVELKLTEKPKESKSDKDLEVVYICPVVGLEMNGNYKFSYSKSCGCVISERALKELKSDVCLKCNSKLEADDLIPINGDEEETKVLLNKLNEKLKEKFKKKDKKRKLKEISKDESSIDDSLKKINKKNFIQN